MAKFVVSGPIPVPVKRQKTGCREVVEEELKNLEDETLSKYGCYIFSMKAGKGWTPWYVGKATQQRIFHRISSKDNILNMVKALNRQQGTLEIWTVTQVRGAPRAVNEIGAIEKELIELASIKNPKLLNTQNKSKKRNWSIEGIIQPNRGPRSKEAKSFRKVIGLSD